jgi:hypothetical protein
MELIDGIRVINRYQDYVNILGEEKAELKRLMTDPILPVLTKIEYRKRIWQIDAEILAKNQYIEQYRKRALSK